jgi:hypothetical protein
LTVGAGQLTHTASTDASANDSKMTRTIRADLTSCGILPAVHLPRGATSTTGTSSPHSAWHGTTGEVETPRPRCTKRFAIDAFTVDGNRQQVTCPNEISTDQ